MLEACPLCGGRGRFLLAAQDRNHSTSDVYYPYFRCERCGAVYLASVPEDLGRHYPDDYFQHPSVDGLRELARRESYRIGYLTPYVTPSRLVEIGPGMGAFAILARDAGFEVTGLEMDPESVAHLRSEVGIEAIETEAPQSVLAGLPPSRAVVMWHVIEHLRDPWAVFDAAAENLQPGGILVIATPNPRSIQFRTMRSRWPHLDAPRHLVLIPPRALVGHAGERGLETLRVTAEDEGAFVFNRHGWEHSWMRFQLKRERWRRVSHAAHIAAGLLARLLAPLEERRLLGAAYTGVFRKPSG